MARIVNPGIVGELSGKLGGQVYARNRAGYYVRNNAIGTNPNTDAQIRARSAFGLASGAYHSLTPLQKTQWQNFATTAFMPKNGTAPGSLSGFNAFLSMKNTVYNMNEVFTSVSSVNFNAVSTTVTEADFTHSDTPPLAMISGQLIDDSNNPFDIVIDSITATENDGSLNAVTISLESNTPTTPPTIEEFKSEGSGIEVPVGFAAYASAGMVQEGMFVQNEQEYLIGAIKPLTLDTPSSGQFTNVNLTFDINQAVENYQNFPSVNQAIRVSLYMISAQGLFRKIGAGITTIS